MRQSRLSNFLLSFLPNLKVSLKRPFATKFKGHHLPKSKGVSGISPRSGLPVDSLNICTEHFNERFGFQLNSNPINFNENVSILLTFD